jgi:hypothetical protein
MALGKGLPNVVNIVSKCNIIFTQASERTVIFREIKLCVPRIWSERATSDVSVIPFDAYCWWAGILK